MVRVLPLLPRQPGIGWRVFAAPCPPTRSDAVEHSRRGSRQEVGMKQSTRSGARAASRRSEHPEAYTRTLRVMNAAGIPYVVGGGLAMHWYTGHWRATKDLDLFLLPEMWIGRCGRWRGQASRPTGSTRSGWQRPPCAIQGRSDLRYGKLARVRGRSVHGEGGARPVPWRSSAGSSPWRR